MRNFVWGLIALAAVAAMSDSASAREKRVKYQSQNNGMNYSQQQPGYNQQPNMFQQMWNMEQQKNAWLRQTFFGR